MSELTRLKNNLDIKKVDKNNISVQIFENNVLMSIVG